MRIIEPTSKPRTLVLLERYFKVSYTQRTTYRLLPNLLNHQAQIETGALMLAQSELNKTLNLVPYDVTTLYFEPFKE